MTQGRMSNFFYVDIFLPHSYEKMFDREKAHQMHIHQMKEKCPILNMFDYISTQTRYFKNLKGNWHTHPNSILFFLFNYLKIK